MTSIFQRALSDNLKLVIIQQFKPGNQLLADAHTCRCGTDLQQILLQDLFACNHPILKR